MILYGWHANGGNLRYGDCREIIVGKTLSVDVTPECCAAGLHASREAMGACWHASPGDHLDYVEVWGDLDEMASKFCGRNRKVMHRIEVPVLKNIIKPIVLDALKEVAEKLPKARIDDAIRIIELEFKPYQDDLIREAERLYLMVEDHHALIRHCGRVFYNGSINMNSFAQIVDYSAKFTHKEERPLEKRDIIQAKMINRYSLRFEHACMDAINGE